MFDGQWNRKYAADVFKTKISTSQSKINLDVQILFGKIIHCLDPEFRKQPLRALDRSRNSTFSSVISH